MVVLAVMALFLSYRKSDYADGGNTRGCTQEAKICPDGSAVGRTGPNCEFAECPRAVAPGPLNVGGGASICTQEAKLCADGSSVARTGPNCEFARCPGE